MKDAFTRQNSQPADEAAAPRAAAKECILRPGVLLVAAPGYDHPYFEKAVILVCKHDPQIGTLGVMLSEVHPDIEAHDIESAEGQGHIFRGLSHDQRTIRLGGPEEQYNNLLAIHDGFRRSPGYDMEEPGRLGDTVLGHTGPSKLGHYDCENVILAMGYTTWEAGALEKEIFEQWNIIEADTALVFGCPPELLWEKADALVRQGGAFLMRASALTGGTPRPQ